MIATRSVKSKSLPSLLRKLHEDPEQMAAFLLERSGLPGPRANLELAWTFADGAKEFNKTVGWKEQMMQWASISPAAAPTNHPQEYLPCVAIQSLAELHPEENASGRRLIESMLRQAANDPRWRMREGCAFGLQRIAMNDIQELKSILQHWLEQPSRLEHRAALVALAHPPLLTNKDTVSFAFGIGDAALQACLSDPRDKEAHRVLRKALEFAPSVFVAADPDRGFPWLERWADKGTLQVAKIVAANLRKARLSRKFPDRVQDVAMRLEACDYSEMPCE